jgi:hypothetical protein
MAFTIASTARAVAGSSRPTAAATPRSSRFISRTICIAVIRSSFFDAAFRCSVRRCSASKRAARLRFVGWEVIPALYRSCKKSRGTLVPSGLEGATPGCALQTRVINSASAGYLTIGLYVGARLSATLFPFLLCAPLRPASTPTLSGRLCVILFLLGTTKPPQ